MIRKFIGLTLLASVFCLIGCGSGSSEADTEDECLVDPNAPICSTVEDPSTEDSGEEF